jgi:hypothetical protein
LRRFTVIHAAAHDGAHLGVVLDPPNTASSVSADTAYRSAANIALLERRGLVPQFQRAKPRGKTCGKPMPRHIARGNARRARIRSRVEHVSAAQKRRVERVIRTIGLARARAKLALANLAYTFTRLACLQARRGGQPRANTPRRAAITTAKPAGTAAPPRQPVLRGVQSPARQRETTGIANGSQAAGSGMRRSLAPKCLSGPPPRAGGSPMLPTISRWRERLEASVPANAL